MAEVFEADLTIAIKGIIKILCHAVEQILEVFGGQILGNFANDVVARDSVKLKKEEKEKIYHARGHNKFEALLKTFKQNPEAAPQFLIEAFRKNSRDIEVSPEVNIRPDESDEFPDALKLCPHEEFLRLSEEKAGKIYPIKEKKERTRLALIICNIEFDTLSQRLGADVDIKRMTKLLESLDYSVTVGKQLTAVEMQSMLEKFAQLPEHNSSDSTFLVFMSHGVLEGICGTTYSKENPDVLSYHTIFEIFNNLNCSSLKGKPKIIIVQACRGGNSGGFWDPDSLLPSATRPTQLPENLKVDSISLTHLEKDFIAFYSTTPNNMSLRHEIEGSPFITKLIKCIKKYSWCYHVEEVFREVQRLFEIPEVAAQMPTMDRVSMTRYFYLFPGN